MTINRGLLIALAAFWTVLSVDMLGNQSWPQPVRAVAAAWLFGVVAFVGVRLTAAGGRR